MPTFDKVSLIGIGGFGEVHEGIRQPDGARVAIKYLTANDAESERRFKREVRCLEQLAHPAIIKVLGKQLSTPPYFYVMPLYSHSLFATFPTIVGNHQTIQTIFTSILEAVEYAHGEGVLHRDLKPENVLMNSEVDIAISDFGLGREIDAETSRLTRSGQGMGTIWYCAPEQLQDAKRADARSDIYSLGRMLADLYCGLTYGAHDLSRVPFAIASVIRRATLIDPDDRYQSAQAMLSDFTAAMQVLLGQVEADSIEAVLEALKDPSQTANAVDKLTRQLAQHAEDGDIVHDALMKIPKGVFRDIEDRSVELARQLAITFQRYVTGQSWSFGYTDLLGSACSRMFSESRDPEARSNFTLAALLVATSHNRWGVMEVFASMIESIRDDADAQQHWAVLHTHTGDLNHVESYVTKPRLHAVLRRLFPAQSVSGEA